MTSAKLSDFQTPLPLVTVTLTQLISTVVRFGSTPLPPLPARTSFKYRPKVKQKHFPRAAILLRINPGVNRACDGDSDKAELPHATFQKGTTPESGCPFWVSKLKRLGKIVPFIANRNPE